MRTITKRILSIMLCVSMLAGLIVVGDASDDRTYADTASALEKTKNQAYLGTYPSTLKMNPGDKLGTEANPFVALEIVPTLDQASFGYFIPGCEPIDMAAAEKDYANSHGNLDLLQTYQNKPVDYWMDSVFYEDIPSDTPYPLNLNNCASITDFTVRTDLTIDNSGSGDKNTWVWDSSLEQYGCFENVGAGNGCYDISWGDYYPVNFSDVEKKEKGDVFGKYYFKYVGANKGSFVWKTESENVPKNNKKPEEKGIWMTRKGMFKCHVYSEHFYNEDKFIKNTFGGSSYGDNAFVSKVLTITPELLSERLDLIDDADLIFIHTGNNTPSLRENLWYKYNKDVSKRSESAGALEGFDKHDLTNDEAVRIMRNMVESNPPALIFEGTQLGNQSGDSLNTYKLMLMATQFKPKDFVNTLGLLDTIDTKTKDLNKSKLYYPAKDASMSDTWVPTTIPGGPTGTFAFDQTGNNITSNMRFDGKNVGEYSVFEKIFIYNGNNGLVQDFFATLNIKNDGKDPLNGGNSIQDMADHYGNSKDTYSIQDVMKYILSGPQYTPKLRVLEIQPCQQFIYKNDKYQLKDQNGNNVDGGWKKYYEQLFPWYGASEGENWVENEDLLQVTTMTTAEFVGSTGRYEYGKTDENGNPILLTTDSSDDLIAKYDLVIIGSMQDKSNGLDGYNDPNLGKLIYTAAGDLVYKYRDGSVFSPGKLTNASRDRIRYSGTDITLKKMLELKDFLKAGKPIVVDQELYKKSGSKYEINTEKVDKNSKLFDLLTWEDKDTERNAQNNILRYYGYDSGKMQDLINNSKCQLRFIDDPDSYPLEYSYSTTDSANAKGIIQYENYQAKDVNGKAVLNYHFYIDGVAGTKYRLRLNLDSDGDGVYRGSLKEHSEIDNMNDALGKTDDNKDNYDSLEKPFKMSVYKVEGGDKVLLKAEEGKECYLDPNTEYYASYTLSEDRLGIVPWKLEVNAVDNPYLRSSAIDFTAFSVTKEPARLNVLQMCLSRSDMNSWGDSLGSNFSAFTTKSVNIQKSYYDPDIDYTTSDDNSKLNSKLSYQQKKTAEKFETYLKPVQEFDVHIQYLFNADWKTLFGDNAKDANNHILSKEDRLENWKSFLSEYDMVVLGFVDSNSITNDEVYIKGLNDFIDQGKSMILSHDTVEDASKSSRYGTYSPWIRTVSGQRKAYYNLKDDGQTYEKSYLSTKTNGNTIDKYDTSYGNDWNTINKVANGDYPDFLHPSLKTDMKYGHIFSEDKDFSTIEPEFMGTFAKENCDNAVQNYVNNYSDYINRGKIDKLDRVEQTGLDTRLNRPSWVNQNAGTSIVKLTNNGQITSYPYHINQFITVSLTHCQNYQLDMDYEVGGDVNVWFNLTDAYDTELKEQKAKGLTSADVTNEYNNKTICNLETAAYSAKDQDSRNNFYIYNKGNITYTGAGHGNGKNGYITMSDDEVKLFVNTMISAYRPPEASPYTSFENANSVASNGESLLYVDYDSDETGSMLADGNVVDKYGQKMVKVDFTVQANGSHDGLEDQKYFLNIYKEANTVPEVYDALNIEEKGGGAVTRVGNNTTYEIKGTTDNDKTVYTMYVPYSDVVDKGAVNYTFSTYSTYVKENRKTRTAKEDRKLTIMILPLFDLN